MHSDYHTQHSPFGAFASFTIGLHHAPGGFAIAEGAPARQNVYCGFRTGGGAWQLLPFFKETRSLAENFTATEADSIPQYVSRWGFIEPDNFCRALGWASDTWQAGSFRFSIYSPFSKVAELDGLNAGELRDYIAPVVNAELEFDNTGGTESVELIFGLADPSQPMRPVQDASPTLRGFASGRKYGYATSAASNVRTVQGLQVLGSAPAPADGTHRLASETAIIVTVAPGAKLTVPVALGFHEAGIVTTGLDCSYFYNRCFGSLEEVLSYGLQEHAKRVAISLDRDAELVATGASADRQWIIAQATHSYFGSSELLEHAGKPLWVVNEGEYRMINTLDLTADHLPFELTWHPWAMRNQLDLFVSHYSYTDSIHTPAGEKADGGVSFAHDMGIMNQFSPFGHSSYECTELHGCFSHMTMEQLTNWVICASAYAGRTGDYTWLEGKRDLLERCKESIERRDHPEPAKRDGLMKWDSDRCGSGSEITTYDSLDVSLGQARNNLYLAVKTLGAVLLLEQAFAKLGDSARAKECGDYAGLIAETLTTKFDAACGMFPAVFEKGNQSRILPAVEGFAMPLQLGLKEVIKARFGKLLGQLETHMRTALQPGICIDKVSGAWKLSSTSLNTWMSKIVTAQYVTEQLIPDALTEAAKAADAVHARWEQTRGCGDMAMCDQIHSETGKAVGSKYYPRIVSAVLWITPEGN